MEKVIIPKDIINDLKIRLIYSCGQTSVYWSTASINKESNIVMGSINVCREIFTEIALRANSVARNNFLYHNTSGYMFVTIFTKTQKQAMQRAISKVNTFERIAGEDKTTHRRVMFLKNGNMKEDSKALVYMLKVSPLWSRSVAHMSLFLLLLKTFIRVKPGRESLQEYIDRAISAKEYTRQLEKLNNIYPVQKLVNIFISPKYKDKLRHTPIDTRKTCKYGRNSLSNGVFKYGILVLTAQAAISTENEKIRALVKESSLHHSTKKRLITDISKIKKGRYDHNLMSSFFVRARKIENKEMRKTAMYKFINDCGGLYGNIPEWFDGFIEQLAMAMEREGK